MRPFIAPRRGVLLLVVLSVLMLFLMLGVAYVVSATRARETAQAYARLPFGGAAARIPASRTLDAIMLTVVRGPVVVGTGTFESLLADKYGVPLGSSTTTVFDQKIFPKRVGPAPLWTNAATGTAVLSATATISGTVRPTDLVGRLLTLTERGRRVTSHRIVRAASTTVTTNTASTTFDFILDRPPGNRGLWAIYGGDGGAYPSNGSRFIINGREFAGTGSSLTDPNEPWDGFDDRNLFLAHVRPSSFSIAQSEVVRGSFLPTAANNSFTLFGTTYRFDGADPAPGTPITATTDVDGDFIPDGADNDGDGVIDGVFQDFGIPPVSDGAGNRVDLRASVLVVDLDGRFNVNAHGSLTPIVYGSNRLGIKHTGWSTDATIAAALPEVPLGSGYGPAEIQANLGSLNASKSPPDVVPRLFDNGPLSPDENPRWNLTVGGGVITYSGTVVKIDGPVVTLTGTVLTGTVATLSGTRPVGSRYAAGVDTPRLGDLAGKYGERPPAALVTGTLHLVNGTISPPLVITGSDYFVSGVSFPFARPGLPNVDDRASQIPIRRIVPIASGLNDTVNYGIPPLWWTGTAGYNWGISGTVSGTTQPLPRGVYNSPPDLHGRMKTLTLVPEGSGLIPRLVFAQPEWSAPGVARETADDPYEIMLDTRYRPGGMLVDPTGQTATDNPFTPAELEPVLRPYDIDTNRLPPRLAAMLGSAAEESRLEVTTDSWDTTAITGSAARLLFGTQGGATGWLQRPAFDSLVVTSTSSPLLGILGAEVARGERFDLNRPLTALGAANASYNINNVYYRQRQAYFKDLFTLLVALNQGSGPASPSILADNARIAQWTANVVEFRDADSVMTPFECDLDPSNGWDVDGDVQTDEGVPADRVVVFGAERPEILIAETLAWERVDSGTTGGLCISLHRPWNAVATGTGSEQIPAEPCDYAFDTLAVGTGQPLNVVDLGKKPLNSGTHPIWRLRITTASGTQFVRLDTNTSGTTNELLVSGTGRLPVDTTLTVYSSTSLMVGTNPRTLTLSGSTLAAVTSGSFRVAGGPAGPAFSAPFRTGTIFLERLANPSGTATAAIWSAPPLLSGTTSGTSAQQYVVVDSSTLSICNTGTQVLPVPELTSTVRVVTGSAAPWRAQTATSTVTNGFPTFPSLGTGSAAWMPWPNRPFVSSAELILVPRGGAMDMLTNYQPPTPAAALPVNSPNGIPVALSLLFDAIHVPTRFAGIHQTGTTTLTAAGIFSTGSNAITTVNQLSSFREPGRVNLNTVTSDDVWNAVVAGPLPGPVVPRTASTITTTGTPAQNMHAALSLASGTGTVIVSDTATGLRHDLNPLHQIYTATRLANTVTPRSNVFAIWITLRESVANDPDSVKYHRAFYIIDRSVPVAFEEGRDYNVWDCIRLRRFIE